MPEFDAKKNAEEVEHCFGDIAKARGLVTPEELDYCRKIRLERKTEKGYPRMGEIMMSEGLITKPQALDILKAAHLQLGDSQRIGGYELIEKLGEGAMGAVYKAKQLSMGRIVALKLLPRSLSTDKNVLDRFLREARIVANLNHPNIVRGFEIGEANGYHYFAMEFVDGGTVHDRLKKEGKIPESDCINIALQCCRALQHAHDAGVVHRDIKPDNLMITTERYIKVADLGLATREDTQSLTATGNTVGTPYYMAPEQVTAECKLDGRADIYALGASLYHIVTGEPPFTGSSTPAIMSMRLMNDPVAPSNIHKGVSKGFSAILMKMMARKKEKRYQNCNEIIKDLELLEEGGVPSCLADEEKSMLRSSRKKVKNPLGAALGNIEDDEVIEIDEAFETRPVGDMLPEWITPVRVAGVAVIFLIAASLVWFIKNSDQLFSPSHPEGEVWEIPTKPLLDKRREMYDDWQKVLVKVASYRSSPDEAADELDKFIENYPDSALRKRAEMFRADINPEE